MCSGVEHERDSVKHSSGSGGTKHGGGVVAGDLIAYIGRIHQAGDTESSEGSSA